MKPIIPVILAGGAGERLWPLSKLDYPKQFVAMAAYGTSLFQESVIRVADRSQFAAPIIVCNEAHRFIIREQLRALGCDDATLVIEPVARNTAPALALAALHVEDTSPHSVLLVMPSDHQIDNIEAFHNAVARGADLAVQGWLTTFAMTPTAPETGYGYIKLGEELAHGASQIARFVEKPKREAAEAYLAEGGYGWNSGIFVMESTQALAELALFEPAMFTACLTAYRARTQDEDFIRPQPEALRNCPPNSIDYALMEHTTHGAVIPVAMGWSDLGSWTALAEMTPADAANNAILGKVVLEDSSGCYIRSDGALIAGIGLQDMVVVAADNAFLVGPKARMQEIKSLLSTMRTKQLPDINLTGFSHRPWGSFQRIDQGAGYQVKKLHLNPGAKISLQSHAQRSEHWVVVEGRATVTNGDQVNVLEANQSTYIPAGTVHRLENREATNLIVIEVQTGPYLGEDDITRYEDAYNRLHQLQEA